MAPWDGISLGRVTPNSVDMICSHAVLEYVSDVEKMYALFHRWLKPGGLVSHQIDFSCHTLARQWNGHWAHPQFIWRCLEGTRPYRLNRQPHSVHINHMLRQGFHVVCDMVCTDRSGIRREQLFKDFRHLTDEDLVIRSAFIQAVKMEPLPLGL
jgi:SAM-dependent methyltransferase